MEKPFLSRLYGEIPETTDYHEICNTFLESLKKSLVDLYFFLVLVSGFILGVGGKESYHN